MSASFYNRQSGVVRVCAGVLACLLALSPVAVRAEVSGVDGIVGEPGTVGTSTLPIQSENNLSLPAGADGVHPESVTGGVATSSVTDIQVQTGDASAGGLISTEVNVSVVESPLGTTTGSADLDTYTMTATGTNETVLQNSGTTTALTGENIAESDGAVFMSTGEAVSVLNIANIVNTTVINSSGFITLLNEVVAGVSSWNLQDLFFPGGAEGLPASNQCSLMSCAAEDVQYTIDTTNTGQVTNDAHLDAVSGRNDAAGEVVTLATGDAYGAANVITVANTNIIDSNYRLLTVNGIGTLDGDLVLPTEALFRAFFGLANGMNQVEDAEDVHLTDANENQAQVNNNVVTHAESGANEATTTLFSSLTTGAGEAHANIVNEVNKNLFGGDSMYMLIRVHGVWNGTVYGLPKGLSWVEAAEGIIIYNTDAEVVPSEILSYDIDSYTASFTNKNDITIDNNVTVNAVSGENNLEAAAALAHTGNAYAGANVVNVANTNVVGRNWIMAILNILGDFTGNISFGRPDLWVGGQVQSAVSPVGPGTKLVYTYTVTNNGDLRATDVRLRHDLHAAHIRYNDDTHTTREATTRDEVIGTLEPGETRVVSFDAYVADTLPLGTTTVQVDAALSLHESDSNKTNNRETLALDAMYALPAVVSAGGHSSSGGGGGGGGTSYHPRGKVLGRSTAQGKNAIDPASIPKLTVTKVADVAESAVIEAGQDVAYTVVVQNSGGVAYDAKVFDQLVNPIGAVVSDQMWDIGTIGAGEKISLDYSITFASTTPTGAYTNTATVDAYRLVKRQKVRLEVTAATHTVHVKGIDQSIGNVGVTMFIPMGGGQSAAIIAWETIQPTDGQVFFGPASSSLLYNTSAMNYGYPQASYYAHQSTHKHYIALTGLRDGLVYNYRLRSGNQSGTLMSNPYSFSVPLSLPLAYQGQP